MSEQEASARSSSPVTSAAQPWHVRLCRRLWRVMPYAWGTLMSGIVVGTVANLNTTTTDVSLSKLLIIHLALTFPIPVFSSLGLLGLLTLLTWIGSYERATQVPRALSQRYRTHMLQRLGFRYKQMLEQSLQGAVQAELGLAFRPAAVHNAASLSLRLPDEPEQPLPSHTSIQEAYDLAHQELLILGEPGAGKSTLLLELAHHLVQQAEQDIAQPLPMVLPLSSWAMSRRPLHEWLAEQVTLLYDVSERLSHQWIQAEQLLPLLDGLDEMEASARAACITAINTYHRQHLQPLVVCSRTEEYDTAARHERLAFHMAVVVQSLSREQVESYLTDLGEPFDALRTALKENLLLQTLVTTPLLLQVLMLTYHSTPVQELPQREAQLREQIWTDYVRRVVQRKGDHRRYPLHVTCAWLKFLAQQMRQHNQTIFSLGQLQPDWLPTRQRGLYRWSSRLGSGLVFGLGGGLVGGLVGGLRFGLASGLGLGLVFGLVWVLVGGLGLGLLDKPHGKLRFGMIGGVTFGMLGWEFGGLPGWLLSWLAFGLLFGLRSALHHTILQSLSLVHLPLSLENRLLPQ